MTIEEFRRKIAKIDDGMMTDISKIIAATAVEVSKNSFRTKTFDNKKWPAGKPKRRGSLMIRTGALMNSIRIEKISPAEIIIAAGNSKVGYAKVHNEGGRAGRKGAEFTMPKRQFLGESKELDKKIISRVNSYISKKIK